MTRNELIYELKLAVNNNTLLVEKHDINSPLQYGTYRTVLSLEASGSLDRFINSEEYEINEYYSSKYKRNFYAIMPYDTNRYNPAGFGVPAGSSILSGSCDTFIIASGSKDGYHIYVENKAKLDNDVLIGSITYNCKLL